MTDKEESAGDDARSSEEKTREGLKLILDYLRHAYQAQFDSFKGVDSRVNSRLGILGVYTVLAIPAASALFYARHNGVGDPSFWISVVALGLFFASYLFCLNLIIKQLKVQMYVPSVPIAALEQYAEDMHGEKQKVDDLVVLRQLIQNYWKTYKRNNEILGERADHAHRIRRSQTAMFWLFIAFITVFSLSLVFSACFTSISRNLSVGETVMTQDNDTEHAGSVAPSQRYGPHEKTDQLRAELESKMSDFLELRGEPELREVCESVVQSQSSPRIAEGESLKVTGEE